MKRFGGWKKVLEMGDALIEASETVHENLKGKSAAEISDIIKKNVKGLSNPEITKELGKIFVGRSFDEIKDTLQEYKGLSGKDAAEIAKSLSKEEGLSELMTNKLKATVKTHKEKRKEETIEKLNQERADRNDSLEKKVSNTNKKPENRTELAKKISMAGDIGSLFFKKSKKDEEKKSEDKKSEPKGIENKLKQPKNNTNKKPGGDFK